MKLIFFASDAFALEPLELLLESRHQIVAMVGMPDRRAGRGLIPGPTPAVKRARELGLNVLQPDNL
ncbi:MAG: methionyl-tRNA formyltransferase, partial [Candidatus Geothermincolia bacterium]